MTRLECARRDTAGHRRVHLEVSNSLSIESHSRSREPSHSIGVRRDRVVTRARKSSKAASETQFHWASVRIKDQTVGHGSQGPTDTGDGLNLVNSNATRGSIAKILVRLPLNQVVGRRLPELRGTRKRQSAGSSSDRP